MRAKNEAIDYATGQITVIEIPWTAPELLEQIAAWRWQRETAGITVGTQSVTTYREEMPVWLAMRANVQDRAAANAPESTYKYKPRGAEVTSTLTAAQVLRVYECFAWYVAACFETEAALQAMIAGGGDLNTVAAAAQNPATWPQTAFDWTPPT